MFTSASSLAVRTRVPSTGLCLCLGYDTFTLCLCLRYNRGFSCGLLHPAHPADGAQWFAIHTHNTHAHTYTGARAHIHTHTHTHTHTQAPRQCARTKRGSSKRRQVNGSVYTSTRPQSRPLSLDPCLWNLRPCLHPCVVP